MRAENPRDRDPDRRRLSTGQTIVSVVFVLGVALLSLGDLIEIIPSLASYRVSPFFSFAHELHDLVAIGLVIFAAYKHHPRPATVALVLYASLHIPYLIVEFPDFAPELIRILFGVLGSAFGIWLISRMYQSENQTKATQAVLSQSEEKYRDLYDNAPVAYFSVGIDGLINESNEAAQSLLGYSKEELHGKNRLELYATESVEKTQILFEKLKNGIAVENEEMTYLKKDGNKISGLLTMNPVFSDSGQVISLRGVVKDITEIKQAEAKIKHLNDVLLAIRSVNQLIVHEEDRQRLIQKSCDQLVLRHGYEKAWILLLDENKNFDALAGAGFDGSSIAFLEQLKTGDYPECMKQLLAVEKPFIVFNRPGKQHQCVLAEEHKNQGAFRCKLQNAGKFYGVFGVSLPSEMVLDKEAQGLFLELCDDVAFAVAKIAGLEKQNQTEKRYKTILQTATDGFWLVDNKGHFLDVNEAYCRLTGYTREELLKMRIPDVVALETIEETERRMVKVREVGEDNFETKHRCRDDRLVSLEVTAKYMRAEKLFFVFLHNLTGRKKMEQQLMAQDRLASIGQLVSGVAHEINNPMTSVVGFSELLLHKDLPDEIKTDLKIIDDEANRTTQIVKNLLTFARKHPEEKEPIDVNVPVQRVLDLRTYEQKVNNIIVIAHFASDLPKVVANASQLQQVFFNLAINAEFFMLKAHKKGVLTITTERAGDFVRASFKDDGEGISRENMSQIFTPFFTTREVGKGTGLGLSICHGIITEHGGKIYAESELGKGATFIVELPVAKP